MFGLLFITLLTITAIFADFIAPYGMREQNLANALQFPSRSHWFGTDDLGRDVLSRLIYGTRISLTVGVCAVLLALFFGGILGVLSGYFRGWIDTLIMRFVTSYYLSLLFCWQSPSWLLWDPVCRT